MEGLRMSRNLMKKRLATMAVLGGMMLAVTGCGHEHTWTEATCTAPKTCDSCGETEGDVLEHTWVEATCTAPKTCSVCGVTEGEVAEHSWTEATCAAPKTCSVCGETEGEVAEHAWTEATCTQPKTCSVCGTTEGDALGHGELSEANYQSGPICSICGEVAGDALVGDYDNAKYSLAPSKETSGTFKAKCDATGSHTTDIKVSFSDFETMASDEKHEAKDGYVWHKVVLNVSTDENAKKYGFQCTSWIDDYYTIDLFNDSLKFVNDNYCTFSVNYNGTEYKDCVYANNRLSDDETANGFTSADELWVRVPEGYDGFVIAFMDEYASDISYLWEASADSYVAYRFGAE